MSRAGVNRRWALAAEAELLWVPIILGVWEDLPRLIADPGELALAKELLVRWQASPSAREGSVRFSCPQSVLCRALGRSDDRVSAWTAALVRAGLLGVERSGHRGAIVYDVAPLLRRVRLPAARGVSRPRILRGVAADGALDSPHGAERTPRAVRGETPHPAGSAGSPTEGEEGEGSPYPLSSLEGRAAALRAARSIFGPDDERRKALEAGGPPG